MNLKEVAFMSIEELARKSYVSKAKISKFIKKLAYDNYIAFKDDCLLELEIRKQVTNTNYFLTKKYLHDSLSWIEKNLMKIEQKSNRLLCKKNKKKLSIFIFMELLIHIYFVNMFNTKEIFFKKIFLF